MDIDIKKHKDLLLLLLFICNILRSAVLKYSSLLYYSTDSHSKVIPCDIIRTL